MKPIRFIEEQVEVMFREAPLLEKKPGCPDGFNWRGEIFQITEVLAEWHDYGRRGRYARNMRETHASTAERRGSWGVGKDYYRVNTNAQRVFDLYYDRAPRSVDHRKGNWFLFQELET
ncbi:MAG: hypothetical protein JSV61_04455 [Anaerolineales bacterium]|nr:MAG: hypothetical protein JSV61_04455 [Anaerolineales bacterium]